MRERSVIEPVLLWNRHETVFMIMLLQIALLIVHFKHCSKKNKTMCTKTKRHNNKKDRNFGCIEGMHYIWFSTLHVPYCSAQLKTFIAQHMIEHNGPLFICWLWVGPVPTSSGFPPCTYGLSQIATLEVRTVSQLGAKEKMGERT